MGKMTSLLEKYKLIEKDTPLASTTISSDTSSPIEHSLTEEAFLEETSIEEPSVAAESTPEPIVMESTYTEEINVSSPVLASYDHLMMLDEIYHYLNMGDIPTTQSVFLLENLIKALPEELPEFVKKTTIHNIIEASLINLPLLLEDGRLRTHHLTGFIQEFTSTNEVAISNLKGEIARLSSIISEYQQQIKHMENLISEEKTLIQTEQARVENILEFFNS